MSFTSNDYPVLVAPRPVRLSSAYHAITTRAHTGHDRVRIGDSNPIDDFKLSLFSDSSSDKDLVSPRSSPRAALPTEALEEFLSILRPPFFPPSSPVLRTRRQGAASLPALPQERTFPIKGRVRLEIIPQSNDLQDEMDVIRSQQHSRSAILCTPDSLNGSESLLDPNPDTCSFRWCKTQILSSPISRNHTRNPFVRHASSQSPRVVSPAAIPLPLPTPDEMRDMSLTS